MHHLRSLIGCLAVIALTACSQRDKKPRLPTTRIIGTWQHGTVTLVLAGDGMARRIDSSVSPAQVAAGTWDGADSLLRLVVQPVGGAPPRLESLLYVIHRDTLIRSNDSTERLVRAAP